MPKLSPLSSATTWSPWHGSTKRRSLRSSRTSGFPKQLCIIGLRRPTSKRRPFRRDREGTRRAQGRQETDPAAGAGERDSPPVLDLAADGIPVAVACRVLGFSKQAFYAWKASPVMERDGSDAHLINAAVNVHRDDPAFGYRVIADELKD